MAAAAGLVYSRRRLITHQCQWPYITHTHAHTYRAAASGDEDSRWWTGARPGRVSQIGAGGGGGIDATAVVTDGALRGGRTELRTVPPLAEDIFLYFFMR